MIQHILYGFFIGFCLRGIIDDICRLRAKNRSKDKFREWIRDRPSFVLGDIPEHRKRNIQTFPLPDEVKNAINEAVEKSGLLEKLKDQNAIQN